MRAVLGLGSSVPEARRVLDSAVERLTNAEDVGVCGVSPYVNTPPWGGVVYSRFVNAAVCVQTSMDVDTLLHFCFAIEHEHGRIRTVTNGPRTLDVDILMTSTSWFSGRTRFGADLLLPHPGLDTRDFARIPLQQAMRRAGWVREAGSVKISLRGT